MSYLINMKGVMMSKTWYTGIADSEGIESFVPLSSVDDEQISLWHIRANSNPQRYAVVYKVELDDKTSDNVHHWLEQQNYLNALRSMGRGIEDNNLEAEATNKKYWNLITKHSHTLTKITEEDNSIFIKGDK